MADDRVVLVCALADHPRIAPGTVFTHLCVECSRRLATAPNGQEILRRFPQAETLCGDCFTKRAEGVDYEIELAGSMADVREAARRSLPNPYRGRN